MKIKGRLYCAFGSSVRNSTTQRYLMVIKSSESGRCIGKALVFLTAEEKSYVLVKFFLLEDASVRLKQIVKEINNEESRLLIDNGLVSEEPIYPYLWLVKEEKSAVVLPVSSVLGPAGIITVKDNLYAIDLARRFVEE